MLLIYTKLFPVGWQIHVQQSLFVVSNQIQHRWGTILEGFTRPCPDSCRLTSEESEQSHWFSKSILKSLWVKVFWPHWQMPLLYLGGHLSIQTTKSKLTCVIITPSFQEEEERKLRCIVCQIFANLSFKEHSNVLAVWPNIDLIGWELL
jgi:hypothetical protein